MASRLYGEVHAPDAAEMRAWAERTCASLQTPSAGCSLAQGCGGSSP